MKKFFVRSCTTLVGATVVAVMVLLLPKWVFHLALFGFGMVGVIEMSALTKGHGVHLMRVPVIFVLAYGISSLYVDVWHIQWLPYLALVLPCLLSLQVKRGMKTAFGEIGASLLASGYLGMALIGLAYIFALDDKGDPTLGRHLVLFCVLIVWAGDSCAYLFGSMFGRHKIAKTISPKKSLEGAIANLAGNVLACYLGKVLLFDVLTITDVVVLSLLFWFLGLFGDLVESVWKRGSNIKDSGQIFPGHGGAMDRVDSIFLTAPVFYVYITWVYAG